MKVDTIVPCFVDSAPRELEHGVIYVSDRFKVALHRCCCGCGAEVVMPLNSAGWSYQLNGQMISFKPSIGNWSLPCKSHYWIFGNRIVWGKSFTTAEIAKVKARDARDLKRHIQKVNSKKSQEG